jgi:hypothetical protein
LKDFDAYGIHPAAIAPAIRQVVQLGFVKITRKGSAGNEKYRLPTLYALTYQIAGSNQVLGDDWKRIQTDEEAGNRRQGCSGGQERPARG